MNTLQAKNITLTKKYYLFCVLEMSLKISKNNKGKRKSKKGKTNKKTKKQKREGSQI